MTVVPALERFSEPTRTWFAAAFAEPTPAQAGAWEAIGAGKHALVVAPTGSGKTLSAFLWSIDRLLTTPPPKDKKHRTRVLYISPLKALGVDVERNLRSPLTGIRHTADRLGTPVPELQVGVRSGDTAAADRRKLSTSPPDILITTPESLFLMLTSQARESLRGVETVILDEVHAVAGSKRGAHLAVSLERLDEMLDRPAQRIGLSATVRPLEEVARFLGGAAPVEIVAPPAEKRWDLSVVVPVEDMTQPGDVDDSADDGEGGGHGSIWPHVEESVVDLIEQHTSTIVFANSRRLAERLTARLNEIATTRAEAALPEPGGRPAEVMAQSGATKGAETVIAKAHHGSVSKEQRALIEDDLKRGRLPAVVATSSLELGIDMGAVDLVIQIESPPSVASALQRVGRAGHQVGEVSRGVLYPKHRGDLAQTAVAVQRMRTGGIEALRIPANPLDVLAQQVVAATALEPVDADELYALMRRSAPFHQLPRSAYDATLDLLAGRYPSDEFAELRPRIVWDRVTGALTGRPGSQRLAVTSGGTIPDRGLFGVFLVGGEGPGRRVGELDEEMVYESRVGDIFALGATSWRIEDITHDRVLVTPAPGVPGRLPFWKGDTLGRPAELGAAIGEFTRELGAMPRAKAEAQARANGLDEWAAGNLVGYLHEQLEATRVLPSDTTLLVERFRDELGDWRLVVHSPYGVPVHAPWALAINARLRERYGVDGQALASDDGIVIRIPDTDADPPTGDLIVFEAEEIEQLVTQEVGGSALFAARFRECAARALLLPRRDPGRRSPLWQQRQRAAALLEVASKYPSFPIVLEAVRECLQDVYDLPALVGLMRAVDRREVVVSDIATTTPSPYARSLLFGYVAQFVYEGDSPIAERRAAALSLDQGLLAELLGRAELRELLDPEVLAEVEAELQRLAPERHVRDAEGVTDLLRLLGPLSVEEVTARSVPGSPVDRLARGDGHRAPGRRGPARRRPALGRRRGRRPPARRPRGPGAPGHPRGLRRARRGPAGRPRRPVRPHPRPLHHRRGGRAARARRRRRPSHPAAARHAGPRARRRVPAGRLRVGVVRRRGAPAAAPALPGPAAPGGRARRACRPGPVPRRLAARDDVQGPARRRRRRHRHRPARGMPGSGLRARAARAGRPGARLRAVLPRRAHGDRRGGVGRPRAAARQRRLGQPPPGRPGPPHAARTRSVRGRRARRRRCSPRSAGAARGSSTSSPARCASTSRSRAPPTRRSAPPCGSWCGPAVPATTPSRRCARSPARGRPPTAPAVRRRVPGASRAPGRPRPRDGGRCCPRSTPTPPAAPRRPPSACSSVTGSSSVVRSSASACPAASPASTRCSRPSRSPAAAAAATSSTGSEPPSSAPAGAIDRLRTFSELPTDQKPDAVAMAATDPANPYGAALPWPARPGRRPPARPQGRGDRRARRRVADPLRRARRAHPAHLDRRGRPAHARPPAPWPTPSAAARSAGSRSRRPTARRCSVAAARRCARRSTPPGSSPPRRG